MSALIDQISSRLLSDPERKEVVVHLEEVLASQAFASSRRSREFLRYVVEETLQGRGTAIKERNIAVDIFGKGPEFDSQTDSVVRVKAAEVRKRLVQAYEGNELRSSLRIELPVGGYQPLFHFPSRRAHLISEARVAVHRWSWRSLQGPWPWAILVVTLLTLVAVAARMSQPRSAIDLLWYPFTRQSQPVLISLPAPTVLEMKNKTKWLPLRDAVSIPSADLRQMDSYYVGVGAAQGAARFAEQLALRHHAFILKFGDDVSFADLRQSPAILLGAFTSHWTMELTKHLPFQLAGAGMDRIVDSTGANRFWQSDSPSSQSEPRIGYALITRLLRSDSGNLLLMAAGIGAHDTQAAVDFLSHEEYFDQFAKQTPAWAHQNFQIVVRSPIHGHTPGPPTAVAWRAW
jgi:hypothetical protein